MRRDTRSAYRARARDTEALVTAAVDAVAAERDERWRAAKAAAVEMEATRHRFTRAELVGATHVRDRFGNLREVVRVNAKTVTVTTPWSWTETIPFEKVHGVIRAVAS